MYKSLSVFIFYNNLINLNLNYTKYSTFIKLFGHDSFCKFSCLNFVKIIYGLENLQFKTLIELLASENFELKYIKNKTYLIDLIYNFLSVKFNFRLTLLMNLNIFWRYSLSNLFKSSNWSERECWDRHGIFFIEHPDRRRILTDYGFLGFPLRKSFPCVGFTEVYYDEEIEGVVYTLSDLVQDNRFFFFNNPWVKNL